MTINSLIQTSRPTVTELVENLRRRAYFVDDSFQRRLVWTERQKVRLIQTILMGYPVPEIYLWQQPADPESGRQTHSIVDGQQRLTALTQFTANEWSLNTRYLDEVDGWEVYRDRKWKDLEAASKQAFWEYVVNVRTIPSNVESQQIVDVFTRLNETDKSLNPQELRNAEFNGEFIKASEQITELDSFKSLDAFTDAQIRRMGDIEFASSLLMFLRRGLIEENVRSINETYDLYNDEYPEARDDVGVVDDFLKKCREQYFSSDATQKMFSKPVHLFSLFCVVQQLAAQGASPIDFIEKLDDFVRRYQSNDANVHDELTENYRDGASSRTRSRSSRNARISSLLTAIQ